MVKTKKLRLKCRKCGRIAEIESIYIEGIEHGKIEDNFICESCDFRDTSPEQFELKSEIFTPNQMTAIFQRLEGDRNDPYGTFAKIKPKLKEIINFWFPQKKDLEKII